MIVASARNGYLAGAVLLGMVAFGPAVAMASPNDAQAASTEPQALSDNPAPGDDIVVTAQRRASTQQRTPASIQVISGAELQSKSITTIDQIASLTPGLKVDNNAGRGYVYIRGIGTDSVGIGVDPSVATYLDGVYSPRGNAVFGGIWDIDHIEVLKGPQGTLYGRNATGGAILTITKQPTLGTITGYGLASYGNLDRKRVEGALNVPLGDKVALRVSGMYLDDDGYMNNLFSGKKVGDQTIRGGRATLLIEPTDDLKITLSGYYSRQTGSRGATFKLDTSQPSPTLVANPTITVPTGRYDGNYNLANSAELTMGGASATIDYVRGPVAVRSVTGFVSTRSNRVLDFDATQLLVNETYLGLEKSKAYSQSLQFNNADAGTFNWMAGLDYEHEDLSADIRSRFNNRADRILQATNNVDAMSAFIDLNYEVLPGLRVLGGVRYSTEDKSFFFTKAAKGNWGEWTPKVGLQYDLNSNIMLYATATRGFKSGGFNSSAVQPAFGPEKIWSYEAGIKSRSIGGRLIANVSAFHYDYTDLQVTQIDPNNGAVPITANAGSATVNGVDGEVTFHVSKAFSFGANATYLDTSFGHLLLQNASLTGSPFVDVSGNQFSRAPKFSGVVNAQYIVDLGASSVTLSGDVRYTSRVYFSPFETSFVSQASFATANARLAWNKDGFELAGFANNLTNKYYIVTAQTYPTAIGTSYLPAEPRTYGVSAKFSF
jgi:iron complex outermembrane receptor protein